MTMEGWGEDAACVQAGLAAVRLLNELADRIPLRSDNKKIKAEIARIEAVFKAAETTLANGSRVR